MLGHGAIGQSPISAIPQNAVKLSAMVLQLITPEKTFFTGDILQVQVPGTEGDFGVLPGHSPFISTLREGVVTIDLAGGETRRVNVTGGIAEVTPERCIILADSAIEA